MPTGSSYFSTKYTLDMVNKINNFRHNMRDLYQYLISENFILISNIFPHIQINIFKYEIPLFKLVKHSKMSPGLEITNTNLFNVSSFISVFRMNNLFNKLNSSFEDIYKETNTSESNSLKFKSDKPVCYIFTKPKESSYETSLDIHLDLIRNFFKEGNYNKIHVFIETFEQNDEVVFIRLENISF